MASVITVRTQPITREKIAAVTTDPRMIRLLENLIYDVTVTIPDGADDLQIGDGPPEPVFVTTPEPAADLSALVSDLTTRLAVVERAVAQIQEDVTP